MIHHGMDDLQGFLLHRLGELGIKRRCPGAAVPHLFLDGSQIQPLFQKVCTVAVTQAVNRDLLMDIAADNNCLE